MTRQLSKTTSPSPHAQPEQPQAFAALEWCWPRHRADTTTALLSGVTRLGRDESTSLVLADPEVSRLHAEIRVRRGKCCLRDLGSRNGTFVNSERVDEAVLTPGDVVRLGSSIAIFDTRMTSDPPPRFRTLAEDLLGGEGLAGAIEPARRAARSTVPIVLEGESGTGKEPVARAIHTWSRRSGPLVSVNCAAIPPGLAEAELFGYRKGAFTGASASNEGYFRAAHGGTLFLDEVAELPLPNQAKLLRAVERMEVVPLGATKPVPIDVRILASTPVPLAVLVDQGTFRADLFARLSGLTIRLPRLAERRADVPQLFEHFFRTLGGTAELDTRLVERLLVHDFRLNVRELRQAAHCLASVYGQLSTALTATHLEPIIGTGSVPAPRTSLRRARREIELPAVRAKMNEHQGNVSQVAHELGISRQRVYRLLRESGEAT